ncbi:hypothetical protein QLQ15_01885 [Lysobacter sp. LF1]|uniref:TIGR04222 domain-containing membrane protein n=1 Tax=Lysobacter stagni TaxID=3045172 RepID=A0ABT6XBY5_9GAMM|nr:hypothetical protein [Lysobacter sp. LF1]MDI9237657.1 hypothetical protein [Lysobacter sp. LF1]
MNLPMDVLLVVGVIALYLQDSAMLLHYDEVVLTRDASRWHATAGGTLEFRGRRLFVPDAWRPTRAAFRTSWLQARNERPRTQLGHFIGGLAAVRRGCRWLWALLLVGLPVLLWVFPHPLALLALTVLVYATTAWLGWRVWRFRRVLELQPREALSMGFELLCCPPHAINLVRRLSLRRGLDGDAIVAVQRWLNDDEARQARECMRGQLAYAMDFHGEQASLVQARQRLEETQ